MDFEENNLEVDGSEDNCSIFNDDLEVDEIYDIPEFSRIIQYFGNSLNDNDWMRQTINADFVCESKYSVNNEPYKYMSSNLIKSNNELNKYLDDFITEIKVTCQEIHKELTDNSVLTHAIKEIAEPDSLTNSLKENAAVETYYCGRIQYNICENIYLEAAFYHRGERVLLDFSELDNSVKKADENLYYSIFPGKIVILKGHNYYGTQITITNFINYSKFLKPNFPLNCPKVLEGKESFNIVFASGPFIKFYDKNNPTDTTQIKAIADYLKRYNPDVLFLIGPFFDQTFTKSLLKWSIGSELMENYTYPYLWNMDKLFKHQISALCTEIEGLSIHTKIIIIPSSNELGKINIFPMFPTKVKSTRKILSFSNPSLLNIGGICLGLISTDVLLHMAQKEIHNINPNYNQNENHERLRRLCEHILAQRHFYPLLPPDSSLNVEYKKYESMRMTTTPHLLVLPSILRPFIYNINGTIVLNPGKVAKNTIARVMFEGLGDANKYTGSLSQYTNVEIIKLIHK